MLVLTRRTDETIMIGDPKKPEECIEVVVVEVRGDQVRMGCTRKATAAGAGVALSKP